MSIIIIHMSHIAAHQRKWTIYEVNFFIVIIEWNTRLISLEVQ